MTRRRNNCHSITHRRTWECNIVKKVLRQVVGSQRKYLTSEAVQVCVSMIKDIVAKLLYHSKDLMDSNPKKVTLESRTVQMAVRLELNGELAKYAICEGMIKVQKFTSGLQEYKAAALVPHTKIRNVIKNSKMFNRVSKGASVYLAAVIEYILLEVLELASYNASESFISFSKRIKPYHINMGVRKDGELNYLFRSVTIAQGGNP